MGFLSDFKDVSHTPVWLSFDSLWENGAEDKSLTSFQVF